MLLKQFIIKTSQLVFIISGLCIAIFKLFYADKFTWFYPFLPVIFGVANVVIFYTLLKVKDLSPIKFSNRYLLCTTVKLLGSIFFIVLFLLLNKAQAIPFLATFLVVYFVFLVHEIIAILKFFNKNEKTETTHAKT